jgi:hypothetical protein
MPVMTIINTNLVMVYALFMMTVTCRLTVFNIKMIGVMMGDAAVFGEI